MIWLRTNGSRRWNRGEAVGRDRILISRKRRGNRADGNGRQKAEGVNSPWRWLRILIHGRSFSGSDSISPNYSPSSPRGSSRISFYPVRSPPLRMEFHCLYGFHLLIPQFRLRPTVCAFPKAFFFINVLTSSIFPVDRAYYFRGTSSSFHTELTRINATLVIRSGRCTDDIDFSIWITIVEFFIALLSTLRIFANLYVSSVVSNNLFVRLFRDKRCKSPLTYNVRNEVKHVGNSTDYNGRVTVCTKFCEASFSSYRC